MENIEKIENDIVELMKNLENTTIENFNFLMFKIVSEFDRVFSKYEIEDFKKALSNPDIKTFKDLL